jgi:hypothetical protein
MAITDLTPTQLLNTGLNPNAFFIGEDIEGNIGVLVSLPLLIEQDVPSLDTACVVKLMTRLREACAQAQTRVNLENPDPDKLGAFPASQSNGIIVDGFVSQIGEIRSRIKVSSASVIEGQFAPATTTP